MTEFEEQSKSLEETKTAPFGEKLYPLDWKDTDIKLAKGRFVHNVSRPTTAMMLEREDEMETETPIGKDGSYALPDETETEELDAKYYDRIKTSATGYNDRDVPTLHKAKVFQGLFRREIYVDDAEDIFAEEITVTEEIGSGDEPDFTIRHVLRVPEEKELRKIRQSFNNGKLTPGKRGKQKFVQRSNLRKAMMYYEQHIQTITGATVGGEAISEGRLGEFVAFVNPLIQRAVVRALIEKLTGKLLD